MLKVGLLGFLALAMTHPVHAQVSADVRMAYFSPVRALAESSDGKTLSAKVATVETERGKAIQARNEKLEQMERTLQQGAAVLSDAARGVREKELEKFRLDTQRFIQDAQAELMGMRRDAESAFLVKLKPAIERVIKDNGIQLLFNFDSGVLTWGDPALDVTNQVIRHLEQSVVPK
ncbi:MAG TPA: OmpH family outer membrane protein [Gemmatimonadaceae bacterium]|nr:OmpH family outer membrane protein [Gemmatimonadaceae bacterium]